MALWNARPNPEFLADPRRGSPHSRGIRSTDAARWRRELEMGTRSTLHALVDHAAPTYGRGTAQPLLLMGLMTSAGWDFYRTNGGTISSSTSGAYPLVSDADLPRPMM